MKVLPDPRYPNGHPYHQARFIVTDDCELEIDGHSWLAYSGSVIAEMKDIEDQAKIAHLFAAAPALQRIVQSLFLDVNGMNATLAAVDSKYRGSPLHTKLSALIRQCSELPPEIRSSSPAPCRERADEFLTDAIADAKRIAAESGSRIYIIRAPLYVDEYSESPYVVAGKEAALVMYPKRDWMKDKDWKLSGSVDPDGSVFLTNLEDILKQLT